MYHYHPNVPVPPFKWPHNLAGNPSTIEVTFLCLNLFIIYKTSIHLAWIKSHVLSHRFIRVCQILIKPRGIGHAFVTNCDGIVRGRPFPFAKCRTQRNREVLLKLHVFRVNIVNRWMACFEYTFRPLRLRNHDPIENDFDMFIALFKPGWAWIIPNRLLSRPRLNTFSMIHSKCLPHSI